MDKFKLVDRLRENTDISYEEAKEALENNDWDILEAMLYLESIGTVQKPVISEFYTNDYDSTYGNVYEKPKGKESQEALVNINNFNNGEKARGKNDFGGIFEVICKVIDTGNNIFLEVSRNGNYIFKLPFTVMAVLLFFAFWFIIPLMLIGLFFDMEFSVVSKRLQYDIVMRINKVFKEISVTIGEIKEKIMKHVHIHK